MPSPLSSTAEQRAKKAEDFPSLFGSVNLTSIRENVGEILKLIGRDGIFREYTLHDANHIDAMLELVEKLIPAETADQMKTADWLLIVLSCYFHDLGMLVTKSEFENRDSCEEFRAFKEELLSGDNGKDYEEALENLTPDEREAFLYQEFVRKYHAKRVFHWIQGQDTPQYGDAKHAVAAVNDLLAGLDQIVRDDLAKICLSHHEDDLFDLDKYHINRTYGDNSEGEANLQYAALILRSADVLQIQKKRVPTVLYKLIDPSNPRSQEEWAKQAGVRAVKPKRASKGEDSDTIEIHASFDNERAYFGLLAYLQQYAARELARSYDWAKLAEQRGSVFRYPWRRIDSSQVEPRGFEGRSYSFTLDQERILRLLTGHTLYNDSRIAIREVLQNALDAVRFRKCLFPMEPMGKIEILWDSKARRLTIRDTGTGMTQETIEKFLLNVGSSFYQSDAVLQQHPEFSAISHFGIGVLSTFMIADEVQILTVHPDDEFARRLTLPSVVKSYLVKKIPKGDPVLNAIGSHGTEVVLRVRRSAGLKDVEQLVRYWLVLPKCEVMCAIDRDEPTGVGFTSAKAVLEYYYKLKQETSVWEAETQVRAESAPGIDIAYVVSRSLWGDAWDFSRSASHGRRRPIDASDGYLSPPGMCVEGIRVRSVSAGYEQRENAPWVFANLTGQDAPRTNVARSDVEQTLELTHALYRVYSFLGNHIQSEYDRLTKKGSGIVEAAWEADYIARWGLEDTPVSNREQFDAAMANLQVIALEDEHTCRAVTKNELRSFEKVWTVDGRVVRDIAGISGALGIDLPAEKIVELLGKSMDPVIPLPRLLGSSTRPLQGMEVSSIRIYPEERSQRIDICWQQKTPDRWLPLPRDVEEAMLRSNISRRSYTTYIALDRRISCACPDYDVVYWRDSRFILATAILDLMEVFGMTEQFGHWLSYLLEDGAISQDKRPLLRDQLVAAKSQDPEGLLGRLVLPFERSFGGRMSRRASHIFSYEE
jgi:hypothetical protein